MKINFVEKLQEKQHMGRGNPNIKPRWKPGESGNPHGRPPKEHCFSDIARQLLQSKKIDIEYSFPKDGKTVTSRMHIESDGTIYQSLVAALIREGMAGNVHAIKELIDRTDGKAKEYIDHTSAGERLTATIFNVIDTDQRNKIENANNTADGI